MLDFSDFSYLIIIIKRSIRMKLSLIKEDIDLRLFDKPKTASEIILHITSDKVQYNYQKN